MFQDYLKARAADITRRNLADIKDLADWQRRRPEVLKRFLYVLGLDPMPKKTPLNARVTGSFEREAYRVEKIVFESLPGSTSRPTCIFRRRAMAARPRWCMCVGTRPAGRREGAVSTPRHLAGQPRLRRNRCHRHRGVRRDSGHPPRHTRPRHVVLALTGLHAGGAGSVERHPRAGLPGDAARGGPRAGGHNRHVGGRRRDVVRGGGRPALQGRRRSGEQLDGGTARARSSASRRTATASTSPIRF